MAETGYTIKAVSKRTGLSPHVIRIWEKRYGVVKPHRTGTNRRLYSEAETERLALLRNAILAGHSIGSICSLSKDELAELAGEAHGETNHSIPQKRAGIDEALEAIRAMDAVKLDAVLTREIVALGQHGLLERLIVPLTHTLGELWRTGEITAAHEHFASAAIRTFLGANSRPFAWTKDMPTLVVGTPAGQLHELGAVIAAAAAGDAGWRAVYLGTSLPAAELAGAAVQNQARAVALSIVYPEDDPNLPLELENLRKYLPSEIKIIVGGRASGAYKDTLARIGAIREEALRHFYVLLEELRARPAKR